MTPAPPTPTSVRRKAEQARVAEQALYLAIREMHATGISLRKLAELTDMSHETIRRICQQP